MKHRLIFGRAREPHISLRTLPFRNPKGVSKLKKGQGQSLILCLATLQSQTCPLNDNFWSSLSASDRVARVRVSPSKICLFWMNWRDFSSNFLVNSWLFPFCNLFSSEESELHMPGSPDHHWFKKRRSSRHFNNLLIAKPRI